MSSQRINESLKNLNENYIFPFFWQHNEDDQTLINEIHAIYDSGIRALCAESRDYVGFGTDCWWHTMTVILEECKKLGMKVWLLDDETFPSGKGAGCFIDKPELAACGITERHADIVGPVKDGAMMSSWEMEEGDKLIACLACERVVYEEKLTGRVIDLTDNVKDGMVYFDLPEGGWRIMFLYKTRSGLAPWARKYADMFCDESTDLFIESIYEEHYKRFGEYFGNTFVGFFSDEPLFVNGTAQTNGIPELGEKYTHFPWRDEFVDKLNPKFDGKFIECLPALWYELGNVTSKVRFEFMDMLSKRYSENFCWKVGNWCREHGVMYIGHVIEDFDQHAKTCAGAGHYFRALDGQDMGGIDTVLGQTIPGMTNYITAVPCSYDVSDPDFFHFTLPKLAPSHSHIQPLKKGRAMCEIYGAYGWVEGLRMMKWMTDMFLVRGVNHYVPHAFSPKFPDQDCPPHFYCYGTHPQFTKFKILMGYMNRMCHIINGGKHVAKAALHYHAEAEWSSKNYTPMDKPARLLTENQLDFDIVPTDYIENCTFNGNKMVINGEEFSCMIFPYSEYLPLNTLKAAARLRDNGVSVIFIDDFPKGASDAPNMDISDLVGTKSNRMFSMKQEEIINYMRSSDKWDIKPESYQHYLRYYHYKHENTDIYMFTNEGIHEKIDTNITINGFDGGDFAIYDALENKAYRSHSNNGNIHLEIEPYNSIVYVFGELPDDIPVLKEYEKVGEIILDESYEVSTKLEQDKEFKHYKSINKLVNMTGKDELPRFAGHFLYEKTVDIDCKCDEKRYVLDLGKVGESATVLVNGQHCGDKIAPPYRFDITDALVKGENKLEIIVSTHYGYELRDMRSKYILFEPMGLLGDVKINVLK